MADNRKSFEDWGRDPKTLAVIGQQLDGIARNSLEEFKKELISEFMNHSVTQELEGGPEGPRLSPTLSNVNITGVNLYSFIGFEYGTDPIAPILALLNDINIDKAIKSKTISRRRRSITYKVVIPTAEDVFAITPLPWAPGRSWAKGVETGISGLGWTIVAEDVPNLKSRSLHAFQRTKHRVRNGKFNNTKYISALLNKYKDKFTITL